jgi:hypothetical protein
MLTSQLLQKGKSVPPPAVARNEVLATESSVSKFPADINLWNSRRRSRNSWEFSRFPEIIIYSVFSSIFIYVFLSDNK